MEQVEVWRGHHGDPVPLFGPLPGVRAGDVLAYEFELPARIAEGHLETGIAIDGLRRWQRFLDRHLHAGRAPRHGWTDFPPQVLHELAAIPPPLGPIVTVPD